MQELFIITNESIYKNNKDFFCDNIDLKTTPEGLSEKFKINIIARKSLKERAHRIGVKNIKIFSSIFSFLYEVCISTKNKDAKFLIISISPYTFLASIVLKILGKTPIIYLRSDGYGEYRAIIGFIGPFFYHLMFSISSAISNLISCRKFILKGKKGSVISPSQLDSEWLNNFKESKVIKPHLLYVGRIRIEKGIFSLLKIIKDKDNISLTVVGAEKNSKHKIDQNNVIVKQNEKNKKDLIKIYDEHDIFILPSYTEGHPMALLEALARRRPVIIFEEITHVIGDKKGIFVSKRSYESLSDTINLIKDNYHNIQQEMKKNQLPTNKEFINQMGNLISDFN